MNGSGKQSFYEIQLNNSSLIIAFVIAVALGIGIFMLGVMVGQGQAPATALEAGWVEDSFAASEPATTDAEEIEDPDLDFFEQVEEPAPGQAQPPTGGDDAEQDTAAAEPPGETPAQPAVSPPSGLPSHDPNLSTGWVVQVKATPQRGEADDLQAALAAAGFPAYVISADGAGSAIYRVRVGRYVDRGDADRVAELLGARSDIGDTWVTEG